MPDVAGILNSLKLNTAEISDAKDKLIDINAAVQKELSTQADLVSQGTVQGRDGKRSTKVGVAQEMQAELDAQNANQRRAQAINYEDLSVSLLDTIVKKGAEKQAHLEEIKKINEGPILDQIVGLFTIPGMEVKANIAGEQQKVASETLAQVNNAMQSSAKTTAEIQTRLTENTMASMQEALAADNAMEASRIKAVALQTGAKLVGELSQMNAQQLQNQIKAYDIVVNEEQRQFMNEQRMHMRKQWEKELKQEKVADQAFELVNLALQGNGKQAFPADQKEFIKDQLNKTGPVGDQLRELAFQGQTIVTSGGKVVQGSTPTEAADFRQKINYTPTTESEQKILENVNALFSSPKVAEAKTQKDKLIAANKAVADKLNADQDNVTTAEDSFARPASWATLATSKAITDNPVWRDVVAPTITDNIAANSVAPVDLYNRLIAAVKSGKADINNAAKLYQTYAAYSVELNNANGLEKLTGLKQTKFIAKIPQPPSSGIMFHAAKGIDATVNAYLNPLTLQTARDLSNISSFVPNSMKPINALDLVSVNNAMAATIAGTLKKESK